MVLDLVAERGVYLSLGYAYVPSHLLPSLLATLLENQLRAGYDAATGARMNMIGDDRFTALRRAADSILEQLEVRRDQANFVTSTPPLRLDDLVNSADPSIPLCIREYFRKTVEGGHLDHTALSVERTLEHLLGYYTRKGKSSSELASKRYEVHHLYGL